MNDGVTAADAEIRENPELAHTLSLLAAHHGEVVVEHYYRQAGPEDLHDIHSVTKSVVSTLVGMLVGDGLVALDTPVCSLVEAPAAFTADPAKTAITVQHLLTMTSGLDPRRQWDIDEITARGEPAVEGALRAPLIAAPGQFFVYNNGATHVLSAVVEAVAGKPMAAFAAERLFAPLDIQRWEWPIDPEGRHWGNGHLRLAPADLLKLGTLHLKGGRWNGVQVLPEAYVGLATTPSTSGGRPELCSYGLLWWITDPPARPMAFAAGHGGQYVVVVPDLDLVVLTTTDVDAVARPLGLPLRRVIMETIVPAFATSPS